MDHGSVCGLRSVVFCIKSIWWSVDSVVSVDSVDALDSWIMNHGSWSSLRSAICNLYSVDLVDSVEWVLLSHIMKHGIVLSVTVQAKTKRIIQNIAKYVPSGLFGDLLGGL